MIVVWMVFRMLFCDIDESRIESKEKEQTFVLS
jgi:hypothetical protein